MQRSGWGLRREVSKPRCLFGIKATNRIVPELSDVPLGVAEREVHDRHILPNFCYLLRMPQREGVIVTVGEHDAVGLDRL